MSILKTQFENWLKSKHAKDSGSTSSYLRCIDILSEIFYDNHKINVNSLYQIKDIKLLNELHKETLKYQKDKTSYLYNEKTPGYGENNFYSASIKNYIEFLNSNTMQSKQSNLAPIYFINFKKKIEEIGLTFSNSIIQRFLSSLLSKPFLICSGLSGSGKTKLAQAFVQWICKDESQYKIVPVGADWTNREPLLGYPNGLDDKTYVMPDSGVLKLMINATENSTIPYFIILDEMNLSHVERYFADFLSIMESKDSIMLYDGQDRIAKINDTEITIPKKIFWPENLFIIGTVNIDETTYMFSPKVLDRANVIEFRIGPEEMTEFLKTNGNVNMDNLFIDGKKGNGGLGQSMATSFLETSKDKEIDQTIDITVLSDFFRELQNVGAEFGYRTATEIKKLVKHLNQLNFEGEVIDVAIIQKLLPKLHGSRKKIITPLETLAGFCLDHGSISVNKYNEYCKNSTGFDIKYPLSFAKIERMIKNAIENGYTSYAEA